MTAVAESPPVVLRGPHADLFEETDHGLVEGPLGTGKTFVALWWMHWAMQHYDGIRGLLIRKKRVDLTQSTLVEFEEILGADHPAITGTASRAGRKSYIYPNGSELVVAGMNNPGQVLSAQYDIAFVDEMVELTREDFELLSGRMRNRIRSGMPFARILGATNPRNEWHWLNLAIEQEGLLKRYESRHWHNPVFYDPEAGWSDVGEEYLELISKTHSGARFEQYVMGKWASDTGLVYPQYDPAIHNIDAEFKKDGSRMFVVKKLPGGDTKTIEIQWTAAGVDWGFSNPGSMVVFGFDKEQTAYLLAEVYQSEKTQDWWADRAVEMRADFDVSRFVCDSAEPARIQMFNDYLGTPGGRPEARLAVAATKSVLTDIAHVQSLLAPTHGSDLNPTGSRIYLLKDTLRHGKDQQAVGKGKPTCLAEEWRQLYWFQVEDERPIVEKVDPTLADHAENAARYLLHWAWRKNLAKAPPIRKIQPGSWADVLNHRKKLERARRMGR